MATPFIVKRSSVPGKRPQTDQLLTGELGYNFYDGLLFAKRDTSGVGIGTTVTLLTPWTENFGGQSIVYQQSVGIGTTNPTSKLQVVGNTLITGISTLGITSVTNLTTQQLNVSGLTTFSNNINIASGIITTSGSNGVGIGSYLRLKPYLNEGGELAFDYTDGNIGYFIDVDAGNILRFANYGSGQFRFLTNSVERFRITNSGSIGIGTTNPTSTLDVAGRVVFGGTNVDSALYIRRVTDNTVGLTVGYAATNSNTEVTLRHNSGIGNFTIHLNGTGGEQGNGFNEKFRFTSGGSLGIGRSNPSAELDVFGGANFTSRVLVGSITSTGTASQILQVTGGTYVSGNVGIGTTNPTSALAVVGDTTVSGLVTTNNLYVAGIGTFLSTGLKIRNPANTFGYTIAGDAIGADYTLTLPVVTANTGIAVTGIAQTFTAAQTFNSTLTAVSTIALNGSTAGGVNLGTNQQSGVLIIGGTTQVGTITLGRSTVTQQTDIQAGASGVGTTKTINFGTGGLSGSFTQINIGPSAGVGTVTINAGTNLGIGTTTPSSALTVIGNTLITGVATVNSNFFINGNTLVVDATNNRVGILTATPIHPLQIATGSTIVVVDVQGNLGIGTTNPTSKLQVVGNTLITGISTLGITSVTNLTTQQLNVSGLSTVGVLTATSIGIGTTNPQGALQIGVGATFTSAGSATFSGIVTATTFSGNAISATYATSAGIATYATLAGIATYAPNAGIATYATSSGFSTASGISTSVIGGIGSITQLRVTGISTFTNGPVLIGAATSTGTASQRLQVTGGAYVSNNIGIGTTNPFPGSSVQGIDVNYSNPGIFSRLVGTSGDANIVVGDQDYFTSFKGVLLTKKGTGAAGNIFGSIPNADLGVLNFQNTTNALIITNGQTPLIFGTTSVERARFDGITGNLGIGTTNPQSPLQVKDALAFETTNTTTTNTNQVAVDTFPTATFRSAKYQVQVTCPGQIATLGGITTGGRGYTAGTYNVTFTTSSGTGSAAQGTLTISNGTVGAVSIGTTGGSGYTAGDVLTASGGSGLQVSVGSTDVNGSILTLGSITSAGIGYTAGVGVGTTTLAFLGGTGTGAVGLATIFDGVITSSTLLQQPTTGTGGTVYYSGSNYTTSSVLTIATSDVTNTITDISGSVGVSTFTSLTAHGIGVSDTVRVSSTSNGLTAGTNYFVVTVPSSTTFTLGTSVGIGTTFTAGTSLSIGFYRQSSSAGGFVTFTNAITGISTNYQVSDLLVLQNGSTTDFVEYAGIANNDILGTFAADISGANARLLFTPTYPNNTVRVARQVMLV